MKEEEVELTINTHGLHNDFYINKGSFKTELMDIEPSEGNETLAKGVEKKISVKEVLVINFFGEPVKMIGVYERASSQ